MRGAALALGLGAALCIAGGGFGVPALYVPGIALALLGAASAALVHVAAREARILRALGAEVIEEQAALPIALSLTRSRLPLAGNEARAWAGGPVLALPDSTTVRVETSVSFARRGRHRLGPASLVIADPLGLCSRTLESASDDVIVVPRVEPLRFSVVDGAGAPDGRAAGASLVGDVQESEVDGLQPHQPGTPASRIHWPAVARSTTLMERRMVADGGHSALVVVDPRGASSVDALDRAVRAAASLCVHLARGGGCVLLLPGDRRPLVIDPSLSGFGQAQVRLALLEPQAGGPSVAATSGSRAVLWVTAAEGRVRELESLRAAVRYLVSPHARARWPVQFTVAGCSGQLLAHRGAARAVVV